MLGTQNLSVNAKEYYDNVKQLQSRIKDNCAYLDQNDNVFNVAFFSDSCYIESENLYELILFLQMLRNDLSTSSLFFNAAVIKIKDVNTKLGSFEYINEVYNEKKCILYGTMFSDNSVAMVYVAHNRFKGIGILLSEEVQKDTEEINDIKTVQSIYMEDHEKKESLKTYYDIGVRPPSQTTERQWIAEIMKAYYFACCSSPRYGKYYISLICNIIRCASEEIDWDPRNKKFIDTDLIYNTILMMLTTEQKQNFLIGQDVIAVVFIDKILSSNLAEQKIYDVINRLLDAKDCVVNSFLNNLDSIPWIGFFGNKNNEEKFRNLCHEHIVNTDINSQL